MHGGVNLVIRPYQDADEAAVVGVWYRSGQATYSFLPLWQVMTLDRAGEIFREVIRPQCTVWVGRVNEQIVAYLAMKGSYIDRMYIDPSEWRRGWGTRLMAFAKSVSPDGLELHTHQENRAARRFYEQHGFKAVRFGTSPPPESVPDVEYHWRPDNKASQTDRASQLSRRQRGG
jgi:GNAT superfamily N-acetyltransferase